jgi:hypothetical protein
MQIYKREYFISLDIYVFLLNNIFKHTEEMDLQP